MRFEGEITLAMQHRFEHTCKRNAERIMQLTFTPTGIADKVEAKCLACGKQWDVSDYDTW